MEHVTQPEQKVPVVRDVDVAVVGSGVSGLFAALGAAKQGARTLLIDRFGQLGGNMGPGGFIRSSYGPEPGKTHHVVDYPGVCREFLERLESRLIPEYHAHDPDVRSLPGIEYPSFSSAISALAIDMCEDAGVELMLSAYAGDPLMDASKVVGVFVETKSGRVAVRSGVLIDATGDASLAERAGVPVRHESASPEESRKLRMWHGWVRPEYQSWNDGGIIVIAAGVDYARFDAFRQMPVELSDAEEDLNGELRAYPGCAFSDSLIRAFRKGSEGGHYRVLRHLPGNFYVSFDATVSPLEGNLLQMYVDTGGEYDLGNWEHVSRLEAAVRRHAFDSVEFYRAHVPGFERARILFMSSYLGARAGPGMVGEYWLTFDDFVRGARFDDVLFRNFVTRRQGKGHPDGCDMPYRMLLPREVDGLLVAARGASFERRGHDSPPRPRCSLMMLGEAAGRAAALSVADGVQPRNLDVRKLQRTLLSEGFFLGEPERLAELGL